jgi:hypothetical protein
MNRNHYAANVVLGGIGWIADDEAKDVERLIEGTVKHAPGTSELHLYWEVTADTMDDAIDTARATLRRAKTATNVYCLSTRLFEVREALSA